MTTKEHIAQIITSILAIVPDAREAMEAALHPVATGKPRAGEWTTQGRSSARIANGGTVQTVWHTGGWIVYGSTSKSGGHWSGNVDLPSSTPAARLAVAQAASDACAREHAGELDWEPAGELPLLTEWRVLSGYVDGPETDRSRFLPGADQRVWTTLEAGGKWRWTVRGEEMLLLATGIAPTRTDAEHDADKAARKWYMLPVANPDKAPGRLPDAPVGVAGMERLHSIAGSQSDPLASIRERVKAGTVSDTAAAMTAPQPPDDVPALPEGWTEDVIALWAVDEKGTMRASWWPSGRWSVWHSNGEIPFASSNTGGRSAALRALRDAGELVGEAAAPSLHRMGLDVLYLATSENGARFQLSGKEIAQILEMVALAAGDGEDMMTATRRIAARSDAHKALAARCERAERDADGLAEELRLAAQYVGLMAGSHRGDDRAEAREVEDRITAAQERHATAITARTGSVAPAVPTGVLAVAEGVDVMFTARTAWVSRAIDLPDATPAGSITVAALTGEAAEVVKGWAS